MMNSDTPPPRKPGPNGSKTPTPSGSEESSGSDDESSDEEQENNQALVSFNPVHADPSDNLTSQLEQLLLQAHEGAMVGQPSGFSMQMEMVRLSSGEGELGLGGITLTDENNGIKITVPFVNIQTPQGTVTLIKQAKISVRTGTGCAAECRGWDSYRGGPNDPPPPPAGGGRPSRYCSCNIL